MVRAATDADWRGHVLERVARLHEQQGDAAEAARHYAMLVALWADADAQLRPTRRLRPGPDPVAGG